MPEVTVSEIQEMKAYATSLSRLADQILKKMDPEKAGKKGRGMDPEKQAQLVAKLRKKMYNQPTKK